MGIYDYNYTNLHCHCGLASLRDSLSKIDEIADRYVELGMKNLSLTDHGQITGIFKLFKECKRTGLKPILGCELYVIDETDEGVNKKGEHRDHLIIFPKSYKYMSKFYGIISEANRNKFNGFGRISYQKLFNMDLSGLIVSSACSIGFLKRPNYEEYALKFYEKLGNDFYLEIIPIKYNANKIASKYQEILNKKDKTNGDIYFLESIPEDCISIKNITEYNKKKKKDEVQSVIEIEGGRLANKRAINLHKKYSIRLVACQDSHYTRKEDSESHQVLLCQRSGKKMDSVNKWSFGEDNIYVKDIKEFRDAFIELGYFDKKIIVDAILESNKITDMIDLEMPEYYVNLPTPFPDRNDNEVMQEYIKRGWKKYKIDQKANKQEYIDRLNKELAVFKEYALERYLLIMADIFDFIRKENIPHNVARGSSAGCLTAYLIGITKIDPLPYGLIFERFLNSGRLTKKIIDGKICIDSNSLMDIDSDISKSERYRIINYVQEKYGHDKVCQISNYVYYTPKSAFKAVCSAYGIDFKTANTLTDFIEEGTYKNENGDMVPYSELESLIYHPELKKFFTKYPDYYKHVLNINGLVSSNSVHAAACVISSSPIQEISPIDIRNGNEVSCFNMNEISQLGALKLDLLGLATTDVIFNACKMVNINVDDIPLKDEKTEKMLASGDSSNVFQFSSNLAKHTLKEINNGSLETLTHINSLLRPGCLKAKDASGMTTYEKYIKYAKGELEPTYLIDELIPITKSTYGLLLFQEQILRVFNDISKFTLQEADNVRRYISKKKREEIESYRQKFIEGCSKNNISKEKSNELYNIIIESSGYIFNLSHSVAYSITAFQSAYLKANHPMQYWCSTLTYDAKKDLIPSYIQEIKNSGIKIHTPHILISDSIKWTIHNNELYAPFTAIKYVGDKAANVIIEARSNTPEWACIDDFNKAINQCKPKPNKRCLAALFYSDVFKSLNHYEKDPKKRSEQQQIYMDIFSPVPYLNLSKYNEVNNDIYDDINLCCTPNEVIYPIGKTCSVFVIVENSSSEDYLLQKNPWFHNHIKSRLGTEHVYFSSPIKCNLRGANKNSLIKKCSECGKEMIHKELEYLKPSLIINCSSLMAKHLGKDKFMASFGNILFSDKYKAYYINMPSPGFMMWRDDIKEEYSNKILPIFKKIKNNA